MKKLLIAIVFLTGCSEMQVTSGLFSSSSVKKYTTVKEVNFNLKRNELIWSRANYYLYGFLRYDIQSSYNPYVIIIKNRDPYKEIAVVREIEEGKTKLSIIYTCNQKSNNKNMPNEIIELKILFDDFFEYLETGNHKEITPKVVESEIKRRKEEKIQNDKDTFFFY